IKDVGEKVTQNLGDLTQIQYIALKEAGFNLELQAFINNKDEGETDETGPVFDEDDDYPVALEGLTVMVTAPLLSIDKTHAFELAHWDGEGKFTLDVPGEKTFINGPGSREMVKIVPNQDKNLNEGDTILDVEAKAYNTDSINNELVLMVDPRLPLTKASLVIAMVPSLNIEWGGAQVKGFYEIDDVADLTEDLEDDLLEDIGRIGIDGIIPRFYLPKSNVSVDVDTSGNTSRKDLLEGATINLSAEYTTKGAVEQPVPILSGAAFTPTPASGFSGFQEFLDDHTGISEPDWVYEEAAANSLPVSRLPLGKEVADTLVNIINKKPQTLKLHYTITLAEELVGVQPPGKDNAVIINIPRPELLLEVPMKLRLKKPANDPDDPAGYARLDLTPFLDEYLPDWQEVLEVKEDGKTLRQKIEDQGVTNLSAKVTVSASYTNTITSGAEAWVTLWEKKDNGEKGDQRLPPQRLAVNSGAGTSSFSFDAGLADLEKNYRAEVELRLPIVSGQDYGILEVKRGGTFELIQVSATVAASVTIEKDLPWSKK
ncbi:MAG: hypothetical protein LBS48_02805, partial [Treponema sp.]|nr:hypothetical protein [Treponema sp.]